MIEFDIEDVKVECQEHIYINKCVNTSTGWGTVMFSSTAEYATGGIHKMNGGKTVAEI